MNIIMANNLVRKIALVSALGLAGAAQAGNNQTDNMVWTNNYGEPVQTLAGDLKTGEAPYSAVISDASVCEIPEEGTLGAMILKGPGAGLAFGAVYGLAGLATMGDETVTVNGFPCSREARYSAENMGKVGVNAAISGLATYGMMKSRSGASQQAPSTPVPCQVNCGGGSL